MSALPPKADIAECDWDVRFVPIAEVAVIKSVELIVQPYSARRFEILPGHIVFDNVINPEACCETFTILSSSGLTFFGIE
jgi:hypothetical protein